MLANLTLADAQLQIGATIVLLLMAYGLGWISARAKDWLQRELLEVGMDLPPAQMTPFRGPLGSAIDELSDDNYSRAKRVEWLLRDIADECKSTFVDPEDMSPEWRDITRRINELTATPASNDQPSTIDDLYTEHSPQIPELRKPSGPFGDDWCGGEYGGSNSMLMRNVKEKEVED